MAYLMGAHRRQMQARRAHGAGQRRIIGNQQDQAALACDGAQLPRQRGASLGIPAAKNDQASVW